jgi:hypothetical protein
MIPTSNEDKVKVKNAIKEISNSMTRIESERDLIKNIISDLAENVEVDKRQIRKMARVYHKQNYTEEQDSFAQFQELYENIVVAA